MSINIKNSTRLVGVRDRESGFPLEKYDDGDGPVWLFGHEFGATMAIRARSFESAWEIAIDESTTIPADEVHEAYGFDSDLDMRHACERAEAGLEEHPDLVEGYEYQSSFTGTGIVNVGHYAWLREFDADDNAKYRLVISADSAYQHVKLAMASYSFALTVLGKTKTFSNYACLAGAGARLRKVERAIGACDVTVTWDRD